MSPRLQPVEPPTDQVEHRDHVADQTAKVWLTTKSAAAYLDFSTVHAFRQWATKHGIASARCGKTLRFARRDLDAAVKAGR